MDELQKTLSTSILENREKSTSSLHTVNSINSKDVSKDIGVNDNNVTTEIEPKTEGNLVYITLCSCICKIW